MGKKTQEQAEPTQMKTNSYRFLDRPIVGLIVTTLVAVIYCALIVVVGRYSSLHIKYFTMAIGIIVIIILLVNCMFLLGYIKKIKIFRTLTFSIGIVLILMGSVASYYVFKTNSLANKFINETGIETKEFSIINFKETDTLENMGSKRVGYVKIDSGFEDVMKKNIQESSRTAEYVAYQTYDQLLLGSTEDEIEYAIVPKQYSNLATRLGEGKPNPIEHSKALRTFTIEQNQNVSNKEVLKEPFTMLMIGVNESLADSIILTSFNPETLKITMTSIPRDSYLSIACQGGYADKVTHARAYGRQCLLDTIENFMDIKIDFYFETDFYALVKIVDALGGLEIESPITFGGSLPKEDNPSDYWEITVPEGKNVLDGKQVITFARERYNFGDGDYQRQRNQQYVIKELANKILSTRNPNTLINVLDAAKENIQMNISISDITALMGYAIQNIEKSPVAPYDTFRIEGSQLRGDGEIIDDGYTGKYVSHPYQSDVDIARNLIHDNLKHDATLKKERTFGFTQSKPYVSDILSSSDAGGYYYPNGNRPDRFTGEREEVEEVKEEVKQPEKEKEMFNVPNFIGRTEAEAVSWGNRNGVAIYVNTGEMKPGETEGAITGQTEIGQYEQKPASITITIAVPGETKDPDDGGSNNGGNEAEKPNGNNTQN